MAEVDMGLLDCAMTEMAQIKDALVARNEELRAKGVQEPVGRDKERDVLMERMKGALGRVNRVLGVGEECEKEREIKLSLESRRNRLQEMINHQNGN